MAQQGRRATSNAFVVLVSARTDTKSRSPRIGITASRKVGDSVIRNRVKRRVREWFRRERQQVAGPLDVVVIVRRGAVELKSDELGRQLSSLVARAVRAV